MIVPDSDCDTCNHPRSVHYGIRTDGGPWQRGCVAKRCRCGGFEPLDHYPESMRNTTGAG